MRWVCQFLVANVVFSTKTPKYAEVIDKEIVHVCSGHVLNKGKRCRAVNTITIMCNNIYAELIRKVNQSVSAFDIKTSQLDKMHTKKNNKSCGHCHALLWFADRVANINMHFVNKIIPADAWMGTMMISNFITDGKWIDNIPHALLLRIGIACIFPGRWNADCNWC